MTASVRRPSPPTRAPPSDLRRLCIVSSAQARSSYVVIGREEGLSRQRVRQIVARALVEGERERPLAENSTRWPSASRRPARRASSPPMGGAAPRPLLTRLTALIPLTIKRRRQAPSLTKLDARLGAARAAGEVGPFRTSR